MNLTTIICTLTVLTWLTSVIGLVVLFRRSTVQIQELAPKDADATEFILVHHQTLQALIDIGKFLPDEPEEYGPEQWEWQRLDSALAGADHLLHVWRHGSYEENYP